MLTVILQLQTVTRTRTEMQEQDVEETITKTVPDLTSAEGSRCI